MSNLQNPTADLETQYGTLTVTFLDPDTPTGDYEYRGGQRVPATAENVCLIEGLLTINRVEVEVSEYLHYQQRYYARNDEGILSELPEPTTELAVNFRNGYSRRASDPFKELPDGVRGVIHRVLPGIVREFYESRPDLQREAKRFRLAYAVETARGAVREREEALREARTKLEEAEEALKAFDGDTL